MTDPQADLTERARALQHDEHGETPLRKRIGEIMMDGDLPEWAAEQLDELARTQEAALQSEREAAAAETRRAAGQWHGHRYSEFQDQLLHKDMNKVTRARIEGQMLAHNESAKHFGAIASPAPQEGCQ